ncbi:energy transducer TonB [Sphingomonas sp. BT-65]|uniref:energy transducer TonB n=1 Tax=Sphingomonas sp. BT-65 TaxID=2989821 RepID=UPI0022369C79|nr:energy transducer TonB [Sphingomonas sp. BT-65]MCW4461667.1 energy transducer TonB [Sphingomonas sp. BT-65]
MPLLSTLVLLAATSAKSQDGAPAAPLKPAGSWVVDYADNACNVARVFGTGEQRVTFVLVLMPGRDTNQIVIQRAHDGKERIREGDLVITTAPGSPPITARATSGSVKAGSRLLHATIGREELLQIESAKSLMLAHRGQVIHLATNGMKTPLAAALTCEDDLLRTWGADPAEFRNIAIRAKATLSPAKWVTNDDYPDESVRMGESGSVGVRLDIAADGKLAACTVISSSTFKRLDEATCAMIRRRARYEPARLTDGKAVASAAFLRFRWQVLN